MSALQLSDDRRAAQRIPLRTQLVVHFTQGAVRWTETDAVLIDLSADGMFIHCDRTPRAGQHVLVGLLHRTSGLCAAWGHVVRFNGWGGFGVQFKRINHPLASLIAELAEVDEDERSATVARSIDAQVWIDTDDPF
ncbi:MAG: PilZ domain-containing protein [Myxococcota bacterium]